MVIKFGAIDVNATEYAAWIGAATGCLALLLEFIKWMQSGARLEISTNPNMVPLNPTLGFPSEIRQQDAHIADVCACRAGHHRISQRVEEVIRIRAAEEFLRVQAARRCAIRARAIGNRAAGGAVAILTVRPCAEHDHRLPCDPFDAIEHKSLVPAPYTISGHGATELASAHQRHGAWMLATERIEPSQQMVVSQFDVRAWLQPCRRPAPDGEGFSP